MPQSSVKSKQPKSIFWLSAILAIMAALLGAFTGSWYLARFQSSSLPQGTYTSAANLATPQEIDRVIRDNIHLSANFTAKRIAKNLVAIELVSGGTNWIVYRFNFPQTCGRAGCLHVAVNRRDKVSIPLQLFDLPDKTAPFTKLEKAGCFSVKQPSNRTIEQYEICQPN
jgi:hypothetical protein